MELSLHGFDVDGAHICKDDVGAMAVMLCVGARMHPMLLPAGREQIGYVQARKACMHAGAIAVMNSSTCSISYPHGQARPAAAPQHPERTCMHVLDCLMR